MQLQHADPTDLHALRYALSKESQAEKLKQIEMDYIYIDAHALERLPGIVRTLSAEGKVMVVMDTTPMLRGGADLKQQVVKLLEGFDTQCLVLSETPLHADEKNAQIIVERLQGVGCLVAVGSGTVCDLCKDASSRVLPIVPMVMVQTALSVNAFSDGVAVVLRNGVKRTLPARYPNALLIDMQAVEEAPHDMNLAGFGDLAATWTAPVDWSLASRLEMTNTYHKAPAEMLRTQSALLFTQGDALKKREPQSMERLAKVLTLSGLAMGVAGESSPCSGTEHIISHLLDMSAGEKPLAYHGQQVSISAILTAIAWELFFEEFDPAYFRFTGCVPQEETMQRMVQDAFAFLGAQSAAECWADYKKKLQLWSTKKEAIQRFLDSWPQHKAQLQSLASEPQVICRGLQAAGAPTRFRDMNVPVDETRVRWALLHCHLMRQRFTLVDLLFYAGWWNEAFVERILERAHSLNAGL